MQSDISSCLIIHGFGGGVHEVKILADYLTDKGYVTSCTKLKGHTGNGKDMLDANYNEWISSAEEDLKKLMETTRNIAIIGFSMGGLIAVNLACKYNIKAIITINTPIYYWNFKRILLNILDDCKNKRCNNLLRYIDAKKSSPIISMINFLILKNSTKVKFCNINCPFLIMQAKDDDAVKLKSVNYIYDNISSKIKKVKFYKDGGHLILESQTKYKVCLDVDEFLKKVALLNQ